MTNDKSICNECETVAHCMKNGCIPKQPAHHIANGGKMIEQPEQAHCPHCRGLGYDASGYACTCVRDSL